MDTSSIVTVGIIIALVVLAYQVNGLREAKGSRLSSKGLKEIEEGEPLKVKHDRPRSLTADGKEGWGADKRDFRFFRAPSYFADCINRDA